jgi:signal transduction histidine kinase/ligand-binding sensor domain-containing protein
LHGRFLTRWWQSEEGLPGNVVRSIAQAADGYIWVATAEGVVRFDGVRFTGFETEPEAILSRLPPRSLYAFEDGSVWISTRGGLLRWNGRALIAVIPEPESSVPSNQVVPVTQVFADGGTFYVVRGFRLFRWRGATDLVEEQRTAPLEKLIADDVARGKMRGRTSPSSPLPQLVDHRGRRWKVPSEGGLLVEETQADNSAPATVVLEQGNQIAELMEDREGNVWAASSESGLVQIRARRVTVFSSAEGLSDRAARALLEDRTGALWVGTKRGTVDRVTTRSVDHYDLGDGAARRPVSALLEAADGTLWAATANGSLFRFADGAFRIARGFDLPLSKVNAIAQSPNSADLWFAGVGLMAVYSGDTLTRFDEGSLLSTQEFTAAVVTGDGATWGGTSTGKLWKGVKGEFAEAADLGTSGRAISAFLPDSDGGLWITTLGAGLFHFVDNRLFRFGSDAGLPELRLTTVLDDGLGQLWLGTLSGILRVSRKELFEIRGGQREFANWIRFDRSDGMLSRECSGGFQPAGWRGRDGILFFPTINGVARVNPRSIALNQVAPPVTIEALRSQGKRYAATSGTVDLGPGRTRMEIAYTGLSFAPPEKVHFRTRLEGLEDEWREVGDRRSIQYEAVPPGRYSFRVQAANGDGIWNEKGATLAIRVPPRFWETAWFRVMLGLLAVATAGAVGWGIARQRLKRRMARLELQRARETERARIAQDLHDDLGASLTEISMLASIAAEEHPDSSETSKALPEIAEKSQALVGALDEIVWAVNPRHDTIASLADYLSAFAMDFLGHAGIGLRLDIPKELPAISLEAEQRHSLFLAVREALNNVVKHAHATEVRLQLRLEDSHLALSVEDDGRGIPPAHTVGDGLRNMQDRLERASGSCVISPRESGGTRVLFRMPLRPILAADR